MSFLDDLMARDEQILLVARRHPLFMVIHAGPYLAATVALWVAAILALIFVPDVAGVNVGLILGLALLALPWFTPSVPTGYFSGIENSTS
ncbi:MAG: hypothetical protein R2849_18040 [Thermomicrobiales bacterium]